MTNKQVEQTTSEQKPKQKRGFALLAPEGNKEQVVEQSKDSTDLT